MDPSLKRKGFGPFRHLISLSVMEPHFRNRLMLYIQQKLQYVKLRISIRSPAKIEYSYKWIWRPSNEKFQRDPFGGRGTIFSIAPRIVTLSVPQNSIRITGNDLLSQLGPAGEPFHFSKIPK